MSKKLEQEKEQIKKLNFRYKNYLAKEFNGRDYSGYISNPKNFEDGVYYHQANSKLDRARIFNKGYDEAFLNPSNKGAGVGLYLGRDRKALVNFYCRDFNSPEDNVIKIKGNFVFYDLLDNNKFGKFINKLKQQAVNIKQAVLGKHAGGFYSL